MGISDKITDGIASKLAGKKIQTVEVSLEDVMNRLDNVLNEVGADEIPLLEPGDNRQCKVRLKSPIRSK